MMVLSRRTGESIIIGDDVRVVIVAVKGDQVRLGIQAPRDIEIDRQEVRDRKDMARQKEREVRRAAGK